MRTLHQLLVPTAGVVIGLTMQAAAAETPATRPTAMGSTPQTQGAAMRGAEGAIDAAVVTTTFTIQDVDPATRVVTLRSPDGTTQKFKCGPEVRNFDQIKQGDQVRATVVDELAVAIRPGGQTGMGERQMVAVAPQGAKPGVVMIQTEQITAKILAVDPSKRMVSLEGPSGADKTIKVSPRVDLSQIKKGDSVTVQVAQGMAITVQSPQEAAQPSGAAMPPQDMKQPDSQQKGMQQ